MANVFFDSNMFIYLFENNPLFTPDVRRLREQMIGSKARLITSALTVGEVMTGPRKAGDIALALRYGQAIRQTATVVPFDEVAAANYAQLRAENRLAQPDAIQLASAATHGVELFVTNDERLQRVRIAGIHFVVSIQLALTLVQ